MHRCIDQAATNNVFWTSCYRRSRVLDCAASQIIEWNQWFWREQEPATLATVHWLLILVNIYTLSCYFSIIQFHFLFMFSQTNVSQQVIYITNRLPWTGGLTSDRSMLQIINNAGITCGASDATSRPHLEPSTSPAQLPNYPISTMLVGSRTRWWGWRVGVVERRGHGEVARLTPH